MKFASLFSGGGGADIGALQAGYAPLWAVEHDTSITDWHTRNLPETQMIVARVQDVDYSALPRVDWLHASPPCINASVAKSDGGETDLDIEMARGTIRAIEQQRPRVFSLENVYGYRDFQSFGLIVQALHRLRYDVQWWHLNAANYGVPQTRRRLILVARRDGRVRRPAATHCEGGRDDMLGGLLPWVGWHEAIADIVDTLPDTEFAPWQLARLPEDVRESVLVSNATTEYSDGLFAAAEPALSVTQQHSGRLRALLLDGQTNTNGTTCTAVAGCEPAYTVKAQTGARHAARAVLVDGFRSRPLQTVDPSSSIMSDDGSSTKAMRALLPNARIVKMTQRALARFQSFPDWYALPERATLACKIIGNAVPPLLMRRIMEAQEIK